MQPVRMLMQCLALAALAFPAAAAPDERQLGKAAGYPIGKPASWFYDESVRVGSFSNLDRLLPHYTLKKAASPLPLPKAADEPKFEYQFENQTHTLDDFLARQRVTGLLLIKDGEILLERYQYDRTPAHRFVSHSMAKSIVSIAVGMALAEGKIASLDDAVSKYAPKLAGSPYGETSIRNVLRMSSGVPFNEVYDGKDDLTRFSILRRSQGSIAALRSFGGREVEQGTRFHYASSETVVLAEADATWVRSRDGLEIGSGSFNAILRDYGRLGVLLANDGAVGTRQVVPKEYLLEATDWHRQPDAFAPRRATPYFGYGYQFWTYPGEKRRFALLGVYGQSIFVDPELKLVMVITAVAKNASVGKESFAMERNAVWRGLIGKYGSW